MPKPPIHTLIDASVRCGKCGTPGVGTCDCWVKLECPKCNRTRTVERDPTDPPGTAKVRVQCPQCNSGDFDVPLYFNRAGEQILPE